MKYGVYIADWNLYEIEELIEVKELEEDYITTDAFGKHVFSKEEFCWVIAKDSIFIVPKYIDGKYSYTNVNEGTYYKKAIFDTKAEAESYGRTNSQCFIY